MYLHDFTADMLRDVTLSSDSSLREAMEVMSAEAVPFVMVVGGDGTLIGTLSDGDVRRFLARGGGVLTACSEVCNTSPKTASPDLDRAAALSVLRRQQIEYLPLVREGRLAGLYAQLSRVPRNAVSAVLMAGGLGKRLRPLTGDCPKPLVEVGGEPILSRILDGLNAQGLNDFTISLNYLGEMISSFYGDGSDRGVSIRYVRETKRLGTGGALSLIDHAMSDPFLVMNGDILTDLDVSAAVAHHRRAGWEATMIVRTHSVSVPYGVIRSHDDGSYVANDEKPVLRFQINAGMYVLSPAVLDLVPKDTYFSMPTLFEELRAAGRPCGVFPHDGLWIDIGSMQEYKRANTLFHGKRNPR